MLPPMGMWPQMVRYMMPFHSGQWMYNGPRNSAPHWRGDLGQSGQLPGVQAARQVQPPVGSGVPINRLYRQSVDFGQIPST